jgi:hypothetical protein
VYSRTAAGNAMPIRTLNLPSGSSPFGVAVDTVNDELFVTNSGGTGVSASIAVYSRTASGNAVPLRVIVGGATGLSGPVFPVVVTAPLPPHNGTTTIGLYRASDRNFYMRNSNTFGYADVVALMAYAAPGDVPIVGDWGAADMTSVGLFRPTANTFMLRSASGGGAAVAPDITLLLGDPGDIPIAGDWDGDRTTTAGLYRPSNNTFYLWNNPTSGSFPDIVVSLGVPGDMPVAGDWDGTGTTTVGLFRPSTNTFYLFNNPTTGGMPDGVVSIGAPGDMPVAGDWDGNGTTTVGLFRPSTNTYYLFNNPTTGGVPDMVVPFGMPNDIPIVGDWDGL